MPVYAYSCEECGYDFETLVLKKDKSDDMICPECDSEEVKRKIGRPGLRFVGPGFHCNDYPSSGSGPEE